MLQSHLTVLESTARSYPTRPAFRTPVVNKETSQITEWSVITYAQFLQDVELYARYWTSVLSADAITPGSIVGLWCVSYPVRVNDLRSLTLHLIKAWWRSIHRRAPHLRNEQSWLRPPAVQFAPSQPNRHLRAAPKGRCSRFGFRAITRCRSLGMPGPGLPNHASP